MTTYYGVVHEDGTFAAGPPAPSASANELALRNLNALLRAARVHESNVQRAQSLRLAQIASITTTIS